MFNDQLDRTTNTRVFNGFYRGVVLNNNDPIKAGRTKVRVFGVYDDFSEQTIPWALYADGMMGGKAGSGGWFIPDVGSHVFVFFENGDPEQPVVFAGAPANGDGPEERLNGYPHNHVFKTETGHMVEMNDGSGTLRIRSSSGTVIDIDSGGNMTIDVVGSVTENVSGDYTLAVDGNVTITGSRIDIN